MNAGDVAAQAEEVGRKADDSTALDHAVRVGIVAYGVVHLLIAWIALHLALGDRSGSASAEGALRTLAQTPLGGTLLYVVAAGFAALVVWQLIEALAGHRHEQGVSKVLQRLGSAGRVILFGWLGWSALEIAMGGASSGSGTDTMTAKVMAMPGGQLLVAAVGVGVLAVAGRLVYNGLSETFTDDIDGKGQSGDRGSAIVTFGKVGLLSKAVAMTVVAGLFFWAAWTHDAKKSGGLDQALGQVLQQPFGAPLLVVLAAGIACYGLFTFAWARHLDR